MPPLERRSGSGKKAAVIFIVAIVVLGAAYGLWSFATRPVPAPAVGFDFAAPSEVSVGDPFTFSVLYANSSTMALRNVSLAVALPAGVFFVGQSQNEQSMTVSLGDIAAGGSSSTDLTLIATAGAGNIVQVSSTLSYATDASGNKTFEISKQGNVAVGAPVIALKIIDARERFCGTEFRIGSFLSKYAATHPIDGVTLTMQYPGGFAFARGSPSPAFPGNTVWNLGPLAPGAGGTILITGAMNGKNTALYSISGTVTRTDFGGIVRSGGESGEHCDHCGAAHYKSGRE